MAKRVTKKTIPDVITREYTIHLHKYLHGKTFKKRAPTAIKVVRRFAEKTMKTKDVPIDPELNKHLWNHGIKTAPVRIRVRLSRKRSEEETKGKEKLYTYVNYIPVSSFKGRC